MGSEAKRSEVKWSEVKWSEVKWSEGFWWNVCSIMDLLLRSFTVCGLLQSVTNFCCLIVSLLFTLSFGICYVLINYFISLLYSFYVLFFSCTFCLLLCVFCVFVLLCVLFLLLYVAVPFLFLYKSTDHCQRVETQLLLINIVSYHIISYHNKNVFRNCLFKIFVF
jgi:hypothetical protein